MVGDVGLSVRLEGWCAAGLAGAWTTIPSSHAGRKPLVSIVAQGSFLDQL